MAKINHSTDNKSFFENANTCCIYGVFNIDNEDNIL